MQQVQQLVNSDGETVVVEDAYDDVTGASFMTSESGPLTLDLQREFPHRDFSHMFFPTSNMNNRTLSSKSNPFDEIVKQGKSLEKDLKDAGVKIDNKDVKKAGKELAKGGKEVGKEIEKGGKEVSKEVTKDF
jgi:hypothetical protein